MPLLLIIALIVYSISTSKDRMATAKKSGIAIVVVVILGFLVAMIFPHIDAGGLGSAALPLSFLVGALVAMWHSNKTKKVVTEKVEENINGSL